MCDDIYEMVHCFAFSINYRFCYRWEELVFGCWYLRSESKSESKEIWVTFVITIHILLFPLSLAVYNGRHREKGQRTLHLRLCL
jgi:hypothetical protein